MTEMNIEFLYFLAKNRFYILSTIILLHIYLAVVFQKIAIRTNSKQSWLAWIPFANFALLAHIARMRWWPVLLLFLIPLLALNSVILQYLGLLSILAFLVFVIIWIWKILVRMQWPGWLSLLLVTFVGFPIILVIFGIIAFSRSDKQIPFVVQSSQVEQKPSQQQKPQVAKPERIDRMEKLKKSLGKV